MAWPFDQIRKSLTRTATPPAHVRSYDGASGAKRRGFGTSGSINGETLAAAVPLRSRGRYVAANNGYISNGVAAIVGEAVGAGIEPVAKAADPDLRASLTDTFANFADTADAEGRTDLRGLLTQMVRATVIDGESFAVIEEDVDGITIRVLPAEMVDESVTRDTAEGGYIVAGVEFNARGQRVAYHIQPQRPTDVFPTAREPIRIDAKDVLHLMRPEGPGQVRGVSWLAPILLAVNELSQLQDALLVGAKISAMHAGFVTDQNNIAGGGAFSDADGLTDISLEPGVVRVLPSGTDIKFNSPSEAKESVAFAKLTLGQIAAGMGVPQHLVDGDLSNANYSSLRAGLLPFRQRVEQFQYHCIVPQVLAPLWRRVMTHAYVAGAEFELAPALLAEWLPPRPMQVDPAKDTQALKEQMALGLTSRSQAVASLGWDVAALDKEIAADKARESDLGLAFTQKETNDA